LYFSSPFPYATLSHPLHSFLIPVHLAVERCPNSNSIRDRDNGRNCEPFLGLAKEVWRPIEHVRAFAGRWNNYTTNMNTYPLYYGCYRDGSGFKSCKHLGLTCILKPLSGRAYFAVKLLVMTLARDDFEAA
jgi:hypothetical protein